MHPIYSILLVLVPGMVLSAPQAEMAAAPVPSICNPAMPLAEFEALSMVKNLCICIADKDYDACTDKANKENKPDDIILCGVRQCQDYNWHSNFGLQHHREEIPEVFVGLEGMGQARFACVVYGDLLGIIQSANASEC
ncbi:hypothetical protein S40285_10877 [Stachybotrys chlorohalonatus IBT 40285]|uniref:Extracellular membrane protein CFEM domain-containing protein n=1 Tax=Stachybotrys chlorohalonatus (strain IBT 40285) TaxID=1283841 RepID=A0A084QVR6_STAC4|nr:hypothetical protein S40285_10877 [Stachybotrys chlorohalonata IBT 40285]